MGVTLVICDMWRGLRAPYAHGVIAGQSGVRFFARPVQTYSTFGTRRQKNHLNLTLSEDLLPRSVRGPKDDKKIQEPSVEGIRKMKMEEAIEKLWQKNENIVPSSSSRSIVPPSRYSADSLFRRGGESMVVESDSEVDEEFRDPLALPPYAGYSDFTDSAEEQEHLKAKDADISDDDLLRIMEDTQKEAEKKTADVDSDEFDALLEGSVGSHVKETPSQSAEAEAAPAEAETSTTPNPPTNLGGGIEKTYTIYDLLRTDSLAPRIAELEEGGEGEEKEGEDTGEVSYIEDIDLDRYVLQRGNFVEAQQFLQDVSKFKTSEFPLEKRTKVIQMVQRARRILDSHKASQDFWDEFIVLRQLNEFTNMAPVHYRPILNPQVKDSIFLLHQSNPEEWTSGKLAQRFRIKKARVEAILILKIEEHILRKTKPWTVNLNGDQIDYMYGEFFGLTGNGDWMGHDDDRFTLQERRWRSARISMIDDEQEDLASLSRMAVRIRPSWFEMPEERPQGQDAYPHVYPDGEIIRGPLHKRWRRQDRRSENIYIDSSPVENFEEQCKMFWVKPNGSMRHVTWEERRRVFRKQLFSNSIKGSAFVTQDVLTDPVIFPTDKEEERLLEEQKHPLVRNRRFATQKVFRENDILREMDRDYKKIGRLQLSADHYICGRMPWSVQQMLKKERAVNVLDTLYQPLHDNYK